MRATSRMRLSVEITLRPRESGYVLLLTLVFIVIISLSIGYFAQKVDLARELTAKAQARADASFNIHNQLNQMLYRLAVVRPSFSGIGQGNTAIQVDNRPYQVGDLTVRLMDQRGLMSLRFIDTPRMARLLGAFGVPLDQQTALIEALQDYIDPDNDRRLNGAEAPQYAAAGLPPPANEPLRDVNQLRRVYGWAAQKQLWQDNQFTQLLTVASVSGINPNAAPAAILATLPNIDQALAQSLIHYRQTKPIDYQVMSQITGLSAMQMQFLVFPFPSSYLRIEIACACSHPVMQYNVVLTPASAEAPWHFSRIAMQDASWPPNNPTPPKSIEQLPKIVNSPPVTSNIFSP